MNKPKITGVQHVGLGVRDIDASKAFYQQVLNCSQVWYEFGTVYNPMSDFFRSSPHVLSAWMGAQEVEGVVIECVQLIDPTPRPIHKEVRYGDIGVNKITVEVADVETFCEQYAEKIKFLCEPKRADIPGWGDYCFAYGADPDGNLIEFISSSRIEAEGTPGRIRSVGISVTDLERSTAFYQKHTDFDTIVIEPHESFSGLVGEVSGSADTQVRSCLLASSNGFHMLELYEVSKPRGRSIPFHTLWGDYGYLEAAYVSDDLLATAKYWIEEGLEFICHPTPIEMGDVTGWFMYGRDPDGIPVEFIEIPSDF